MQQLKSLRPVIVIPKNTQITNFSIIEKILTKKTNLNCISAFYAAKFSSKWIQHIKLPLFLNYGALFIQITPILNLKRLKSTPE